MTTDECALTELPADQCACPRHRGGTVVEPDQLEAAGPTFEARFAGRCAGCGEPIAPGDSIVRTAPDGGYVHAVECAR
jgi:hypothetical protein